MIRMKKVCSCTSIISKGKMLNLMKFMGICRKKKSTRKKDLIRIKKNLRLEIFQKILKLW